MGRRVHAWRSDARDQDCRGSVEVAMRARPAREKWARVPRREPHEVRSLDSPSRTCPDRVRAAVSLVSVALLSPTLRLSSPTVHLHRSSARLAHPALPISTPPRTCRRSTPIRRNATRPAPASALASAHRSNARIPMPRYWSMRQRIRRPACLISAHARKGRSLTFSLRVCTRFS